MWRVILAGVTTLRELDHWSIDDLADAHDALDAQSEAERQGLEKAKKGRR